MAPEIISRIKVDVNGLIMLDDKLSNDEVIKMRQYLASQSAIQIEDPERKRALEELNPCLSKISLALEFSKKI